MQAVGLMFLKKLRRLKKKKKLSELWEKCKLTNTKKYRHQFTTEFVQLTSSFGMTFSQTPN